METRTELNRKWREAQRKAGRIPKQIWVDPGEWEIVKSLIGKLKKLRRDDALTAPTTTQEK